MHGAVMLQKHQLINKLCWTYKQLHFHIWTM